MSNTQVPYESTIKQAHLDREKNLSKGGRSWLTLAGLFMLHEGENTFGSAPENDIVLHTTSSPSQGGVFVLSGDKVTIRPAHSLHMLCNGDHLPTEALATDDQEKPDFLTIGKLTLVAIRRADKHYIRLWNADNPARKNFSGLNFYPTNPAFRIKATFVAHASPLIISITDVLGNEHDIPHIGVATFELQGQTCHLHAIEEEDHLSFGFRDATNNETTYGGGRMMNTPLPSDGVVFLDFNLAYNPPCAYTNFATCPLPPAENFLKVRIDSGEKIYQKHLGH